ncbi:hypothetical protein BJY52DRAFT_1255847 [Lactarius psammicola]|nr:hypothetical protein BJY52DRAFT_1255847 [Lactarius psammicola]
MLSYRLDTLHFVLDLLSLLYSHCFHLTLTPTLCVTKLGLSPDTHKPFVLNSAYRLGQAMINFFFLFVFRGVLAQSRGEFIVPPPPHCFRFFIAYSQLASSQCWG